MHILLIDDSSSTRSLLRTLINSGQAVRHEISEASSGEEAIQKVESGEINLPDLVILDINMGGMTGYELCREFRQRFGGKSDVIPYIIIVTANEGIEVINQALDSGANDYMPKPVNVKVLHVRLRVAERLLAQAHQSSGNTPSAPPAAAPAPTPEPPVEIPAGAGLTPTQSLIISAIEQADAPIAMVEASEADPSFRIIYANGAMSATTGYEQDQLLGKSLADMEAWTPEFLTMALSFINREAILSHVPLWSRTRQEVPVHLSFYPVRSEDGFVRHYLIIHHF